MWMGADCMQFSNEIRFSEISRCLMFELHSLSNFFEEAITVMLVLKLVEILTIFNLLTRLQ